MIDIALTEWEHQPHVLNVITSREMGAWLGRRDSRILQEIRQEIEDNVLETLSDGGDDWFTADKVNDCIEIIDKHIKEIEGSDKE
jgi:hypothetical protein